MSVLWSRFATRPRLPAWSLPVLLAGYMLIAFNASFWRASWRVIDLPAGNKIVLFGGLALLLLGLLTLMFTLLNWRWVDKPLATILLLLGAACAYFMDSYGIVIDRNMVRNVFQTDLRESHELLSSTLAFYLLVLGALPALLLWRCQLVRPVWWRDALQKLGVIGLCIVVMLGVSFASYQSYASFVRNNKTIRYLINPANALYASTRYLIGESARGNVVAAPWGRDAHKGAALVGNNGRKTLLVIVVGETARAQNFSLNGYARPTNPQLAQLPVINFSQVSSCGTETAVSVPCMFSGLGRSDFDVSRFDERENLLDVLKTAGMRVWWLDNNSGSKQVARRTGEESLPPGAANRANCRADECYDMALLDGLSERLNAAPQDTVLVLHQKGNHGPSYYLRYPPEFEHFKPVCRSNQLQECPRQNIINAYDNALRYTDHFLASLIRLQDGLAAYDSAMIYVSDHGESTGENNMYLHGAPYLIAPREQTHVPLIVWLSQRYQQRFAINTTCLRQHSAQELSHDNLVHSVLGVLDIRSEVYQPQLDLFNGCRGKTQIVSS